MVCGWNCRRHGSRSGHRHQEEAAALPHPAPSRSIRNHRAASGNHVAANRDSIGENRRRPFTNGDSELLGWMVSRSVRHRPDGFHVHSLLISLTSHVYSTRIRSRPRRARTGDSAIDQRPPVPAVADSASRPSHALALGRLRLARPDYLAHRPVEDWQDQPDRRPARSPGRRRPTRGQAGGALVPRSSSPRNRRVSGFRAMPATASATGLHAASSHSG